jgi:hypothetical protein
MAPIKKKCWQECGENRTLVHWWWEYKMVQPQWKTDRASSEKLKKEIPYDSVIPFLGDIS